METFEKDFIRKGYSIIKPKDKDIIKNLHNFVISYLRKKVSKNIPLNLNKLNNHINIEDVNSIRLDLYQNINKSKKFHEMYFKVFKPYLSKIIGDDISKQKKINLNIQLPQDYNSTLDLHADTFAGESPYEVITWLPLSSVYKSNSMYVFPLDISKKIVSKIENYNTVGTDKILNNYKKNLKFLKINYGEVLIFSANLMHGNKVNQTKDSRLSLNCRFKNTFSPRNKINSSNHIVNIYENKTKSPSTKVAEYFEELKIYE